MKLIIDISEKTYKEIELNGLYLCPTYYLDLEKALKEAKEVKKGRWIDEGWYADGHGHHVYCCSKCGEHYIKCPYEIIKFKYCPNCGASMEMTE